MSRAVSEIMTPEVQTMGAEDSLLDAMVFMRENGVRHIPIVGPQGELIGLITDRDVKRATPSTLLRENREEWEQTVRKTLLERVMNRNPLTVSPETPLKAALGLLVEEKIGCLPVAEGGRLVGIVTSHDLLKAMQGLLS